METFRTATILLPVPWLQIFQRQIQEVRFGKFELRNKYRAGRADAVVGTRLDLGDSASAAEQADLAAA